MLRLLRRIAQSVWQESRARAHWFATGIAVTVLASAMVRMLVRLCMIVDDVRIEVASLVIAVRFSKK